MESASTSKKFDVRFPATAYGVRDTRATEKVLRVDARFRIEVQKPRFSFDAYADIAPDMIVEIAIYAEAIVVMLSVIHLPIGEESANIYVGVLGRNRSNSLRMQEDREEQENKPANEFSTHSKTSPNERKNRTSDLEAVSVCICPQLVSQINVQTLASLQSWMYRCLGRLLR